MSSETEHDIVAQPEPTCPMIDAVITKLNLAEREMKGFGNCEDPAELREMLNRVESGLFWFDTAEDGLEKVRRHVESIRAWGEEWKQYALTLAATEPDDVFAAARAWQALRDWLNGVDKGEMDAWSSKCLNDCADAWQDGYEHGERATLKMIAEDGRP